MPSIALGGQTFIPSNILPGGAPFNVPTPPAGWYYAWSANGWPFYRQEGSNKIGTWKKGGKVFKFWTPVHPIVFGKRLDAKKFARVAKKTRRVWSELNHIYGKRERRR